MTPDRPNSQSRVPGTTLTSSLLAKNTALNLAGETVPLLVAVVAIPVVIDAIGTDRFGILTLIWVVLGYFGLFDAGLGRALIYAVSDRLGDERQLDLPGLIWTGLVMMGFLGIVGAVACNVLAYTLVHDVFAVEAALRDEAVHAFQMLALGIPIVLTNTGLQGVLQAQQRFDLTNLVRIPRRTLTFAGPLAVVPFSSSLVPITAVLLISQGLAWAFYLGFVLRVTPNIKSAFRVSWSSGLNLLKTGGWMTVSNIVSPIMVYLDRFVVGAFVTMTQVAYYTTPYEIVTKLWLFQRGVVGVLFPAYSTSKGGADTEFTVRLFDIGNRLIVAALFPVAALATVLAPEGLTLWLGSEFANNSTQVLRLLVIGVFFSSLASNVFALIQATGRPDVTAVTHIAELPLYAILLFLLVKYLGILGAALAWTLRVTIDAIVLFGIACRLLPEVRRSVLRLGTISGAAFGCLAGGSLLPNLTSRLVALGIMLIAYGFSITSVLLSADERQWLASHVGRFRQK